MDDENIFTAKANETLINQKYKYPKELYGKFFEYPKNYVLSTNNSHICALSKKLSLPEHCFTDSNSLINLPINFRDTTESITPKTKLGLEKSNVDPQIELAASKQRPDDKTKKTSLEDWLDEVL